MAKANGQEKGFRHLYKKGVPAPAKKEKQIFVHYFKIESTSAEDAHDAKLADAAYEAYLRDPSGARPLDELVAEWEAMDAKREKVRK
jgi:hypothetical protein